MKPIPTWPKLVKAVRYKEEKTSQENLINEDPKKLILEIIKIIYDDEKKLPRNLKHKFGKYYIDLDMLSGLLKNKGVYELAPTKRMTPFLLGLANIFPSTIQVEVTEKASSKRVHLLAGDKTAEEYYQNFVEAIDQYNLDLEARKAVNGQKKRVRLTYEDFSPPLFDRYPDKVEFDERVDGSLASPLDDESLSKQLHDFVKGSSGTHELLNNLNSIADKIITVINKGKTTSNLTVYKNGSIVTGLLSNKSDLDLNIALPPGLKFTQVFENMKAVMGRCALIGATDFTHVHRVGARVSLIKFALDSAQVDISFNNTATVYKTKMLAAYANLSPKIHFMLMFIKTWAASRPSDPPLHKIINTYCHTLSLLTFMQGWIPNLQRLCPKHSFYEPKQKKRLDKVKYNKGFDFCTECGAKLPVVSCDDSNVYFNEDIILSSDDLIDPIGILKSYFGYMGYQFNPLKYSLCLKAGGLIERKHLHPLDPYYDLNSGEIDKLKLLVVNDPFKLEINVALSGSPNAIDFLFYEFRRAYKYLLYKQPVENLMSGKTKIDKLSYLNHEVYVWFNVFHDVYQGSLLEKTDL